MFLPHIKENVQKSIEASDIIMLILNSGIEGCKNTTDRTSSPKVI